MQNEKALKGYRRARDAEGLAKIKEKMGDYDGAIRLLLKHNCIIDALKYAAKYEARRSIKISECYHVHYMASRYAEKLSKPAVQSNPTDLDQFESVIKFLPPTERVSYYKAAGMHDRACEILKSEGKYKELHRIFKAQGQHEDGIQLAKCSRNRNDEATFIFFKATAELADSAGKLQESTEAMLKKKVDNQTEIGAKANLVCGSAIQNHAMIKAARDYYTNKRHHNSFGQIEAFNAAIVRAEYDENSQSWKNIHLNKNQDLLTLTLTLCEEIRCITATLDPAKEPSSARRHVIHQLESFYGLERQKVVEECRDMYFVPSSSYFWTNQILKELNVGKGMKDIDGMLQLEVEDVLKGVCTHMEGYIQKWITDDMYRLVEHFKESYTSHPLYQKITEGGFLHQSFLVYSGTPQQGWYFKLLCNAVELAHYGSDKVGGKESLFKAVVDAISPQATCYLPVTYESLQIQSELLKKMFDEQATEVLAKGDREFNFNRWLEAWRINCVSKKGSQRMKEILLKKSEQYKKQPSKQTATQGCLLRSNIPPAYVQRESGCKHLMFVWIRTCELYTKKETLAFSTVAVRNVLCHIVSERSIWNTVSMSNLLNVVTIHTVAILTMHAACSVRFQYEGNMYFPSSYSNAVKIFHIMTGSSNMDFYRSCIDHIMDRRNLPEVPPKLENLLNIIFKIMIGIHNRDFNPLRYALGRGECLKNGEARHCLIFVLTLFCNIVMMRFEPSDLNRYRCQIFESVKHCNDPALTKAYCHFLNAHTLHGCFEAVRELLESSKDYLLQAQLSFNFQFNDIGIKFDPATLYNPIFQETLAPLPIQLTSWLSKHVVTQHSLRPDAEPFDPTLASSVGWEMASTPVVSFEDDEDDPELNAALNIESEETTVPHLEMIEKDSTVDYNFCSICACPVPGSSDENPNSVTASFKSLYHSHCCTEQHRINEKIKEKFDTEEKDYYIPRKDHLIELLQKCKALFKFRRDQQLQCIVEATESDMKEMDNFILEIRNNAKWREGVHKLENEYSGKLESVHLTLTRLIEETEELKRKIKRDEERQERKDEEEGKEDEQPEEDEFITQTCTDYGERGKQKGRKRKRARREKRSKK